MIPEASHDSILDALKRFDADERDLAKWQGWENRGNFKFAVRHDGRIYPVKRIISIATGFPEGRFSGGDEANNYLHQMGFEIHPLRELEEPRISSEVNTSSLFNLLERVCQLQLEYSPQNTTAMQERGLIVRKAIPAVLRGWIGTDAGLVVESRDATGLKAKVPWARIFRKELSPSATAGIYLVYLFAADGSTVSLSLNQGTTTANSGQYRPKGADDIQANVFWARNVLRGTDGDSRLVPNIVLKSGGGLGEGYERGNIGALTYRRQEIPSDDELRSDLELMLGLLRRIYVELAVRPPGHDIDEDDFAGAPFPFGGSLPEQLLPHLRRALSDSGFAYEPWQVATFVTALRTKPFLILAGISGTGKTKLPIIAARSTGANIQVIPVRPDWHDSGDLLGYTDLGGQFRAKPFLEFCAMACVDRTTQYIAVIDEMNIARVEHYFAEVLSRIEDHSLGGECSMRLVESGGDGYPAFKDVGLPTNLAIVGTVNMDESTHGFSRKVLDRGFTLELSEVDLTRIISIAHDPVSAMFKASAWKGTNRRLSEAIDKGPDNKTLVDSIIAVLQKLNQKLSSAQLQIGFRSRDEIVLFVLNAQPEMEHFTTSEGTRVDPMDLAIMMKILPRIAGSSQAVERVLEGILEEAVSGKSPKLVVESWLEAGSPHSLVEARWPRSAARACLMLKRLDEGYTSFFL